MFDIPCVILCGGKSSRMGEDKSLLPFDSYDSLSFYQFDRLKEYFKDVYISSKNNKFPFLEDENSLILDKHSESSPIIALDTIFNQIEDKSIFIITVDNPFISYKTILKLIENSFDNDITIARTERIHNLCGVFSSKLKSSTQEMLEKDIHKVGYLLKNVNTKIIKFEDENEFINLNFKDDYEDALKILTDIKKA